MDIFHPSKREALALPFRTACSIGLALLATLMMGWVAAPARTTYHVSPTGSDSNAGTAAHPFQTIQRAVDAVLPGDSIRVHAGTYTDLVVITRSGASKGRIVLAAAGDGVVTIAPKLRPISCSSLKTPVRNRAIQILEGADYWTITGFKIVGGIVIVGANSDQLDEHVRDRSLPGRGINDPSSSKTLLESLGTDGADYIRIVKNDIRGRGILAIAARFGRVTANTIHDIDCGGGAGIWLNRFSDGWTVGNNSVQRIAAANWHPVSEGVRVASASCYNKVLDNLIEDLGGTGRGITNDVYASWNLFKGNTVRRADQGLNEQSAGWGNQWVSNTTESNRRYGFNIDGKDSQLPAPDEGVPAFTQVRCTRASGNALNDLRIGAIQEAAFKTNSFPLVSLSEPLTGYWGSAGNIWDGSSSPPPPNPPLLTCP